MRASVILLLLLLVLDIKWSTNANGSRGGSGARQRGTRRTVVYDHKPVPLSPIASEGSRENSNEEHAHSTPHIPFHPSDPVSPISGDYSSEEEMYEENSPLMTPIRNEPTLRVPRQPLISTYSSHDSIQPNGYSDRKEAKLSLITPTPSAATITATSIRLIFRMPRLAAVFNQLYAGERYLPLGQTSPTSITIDVLVKFPKGKRVLSFSLPLHVTTTTSTTEKLVVHQALQNGSAPVHAQPSLLPYSFIPRSNGSASTPPLPPPPPDRPAGLRWPSARERLHSSTLSNRGAISEGRRPSGDGSNRDRKIFRVPSPVLGGNNYYYGGRGGGKSPTEEGEGFTPTQHPISSSSSGSIVTFLVDRMASPIHHHHHQNDGYDGGKENEDEHEQRNIQKEGVWDEFNLVYYCQEENIKDPTHPDDHNKHIDFRARYYRQRQQVRQQYHPLLSSTYEQQWKRVDEDGVVEIDDDYAGTGVKRRRLCRVGYLRDGRSDFYPLMTLAEKWEFNESPLAGALLNTRLLRLNRLNLSVKDVLERRAAMVVNNKSTDINYAEGDSKEGEEPPRPRQPGTQLQLYVRQRQGEKQLSLVHKEDEPLPYEYCLNYVGHDLLEWRWVALATTAKSRTAGQAENGGRRRRRNRELEGSNYHSGSEPPNFLITFSLYRNHDNQQPHFRNRGDKEPRDAKVMGSEEKNERELENEMVGAIARIVDALNAFHAPQEEWNIKARRFSRGYGGLHYTRDVVNVLFEEEEPHQQHPRKLLMPTNTAHASAGRGGRQEFHQPALPSQPPSTIPLGTDYQLPVFGGRTYLYPILGGAEPQSTNDTSEKSVEAMATWRAPDHWANKEFEAVLAKMGADGGEIESTTTTVDTDIRIGAARFISRRFPSTYSTQSGMRHGTVPTTGGDSLEEDVAFFLNTVEKAACEVDAQQMRWCFGEPEESTRIAESQLGGGTCMGDCGADSDSRLLAWKSLTPTQQSIVLRVLVRNEAAAAATTATGPRSPPHWEEHVLVYADDESRSKVFKCYRPVTACMVNKLNVTGWRWLNERGVVWRSVAMDSDGKTKTGVIAKGVLDVGIVTGIGSFHPLSELMKPMEQGESSSSSTPNSSSIGVRVADLAKPQLQREQEQKQKMVATQPQRTYFVHQPKAALLPATVGGLVRGVPVVSRTFLYHQADNPLNEFIGRILLFTHAHTEVVDVEGEKAVSRTVYEHRIGYVTNDAGERAYLRAALKLERRPHKVDHGDEELLVLSSFTYKDKVGVAESEAAIRAELDKIIDAVNRMPITISSPEAEGNDEQPRITTTDSSSTLNTPHIDDRRKATKGVKKNRSYSNNPCAGAAIPDSYDVAEVALTPGGVFEPLYWYDEDNGVEPWARVTRKTLDEAYSPEHNFFLNELRWMLYSIEENPAEYPLGRRGADGRFYSLTDTINAPLHIMWERCWWPSINPQLRYIRFVSEENIDSASGRSSFSERLARRAGYYGHRFANAINDTRRSRRRRDSAKGGGV